MLSAALLLVIGCLVFFSICRDKNSKEYAADSPERKINLCVTNASSAKVLNFICDQTGIRATWDPEQVKNTRGFNFNVSNVSVKYILDSMSKVLDFNSRFDGNLIILNNPSIPYFERFIKLTLDADSKDVESLLYEIQDQSGVVINALASAL